MEITYIYIQASQLASQSYGKKRNKEKQRAPEYCTRHHECVHRYVYSTARQSRPIYSDPLASARETTISTSRTGRMAPPAHLAGKVRALRGSPYRVLQDGGSSLQLG
jgi:hypothetical protein